MESNERVPSGPQGPRGERGEPGVVYTEMKLNDRAVLRVDNENLNNLVVMKSLCIGEKSHCLSDNSLAIGGGICYKPESFTLGRSSKTVDNGSVALFGTTSGKNAFSYRALGVEENSVKFGDNKDDIENYEIHSRKIVLEADEIEIKGRVHLRQLEEKMLNLERKITDLQRRL